MKRQSPNEPRWRGILALTRKNLDVVDRVSLRVDAIDLDDGHVVAVDGENVVGVARDGNDAETVAARHRS
jgi:hypothetical protein